MYVACMYFDPFLTPVLRELRERAVVQAFAAKHRLNGQTLNLCFFIF